MNSVAEDRLERGVGGLEQDAVDLAGDGLSNA